jgi:hypothetical protein
LGKNVIERNGSECKYVQIFTHRVGSIGAPSRRRVFMRGTDTKQLEVPKIAGRNTKANIFQKGRAGFKATIYLNKKKASIIIIIITIINEDGVKLSLCVLKDNLSPSTLF